MPIRFLLSSSQMKPFNFSIDINCDVGEGAGNEAQLFPLISSCNIACGGHAGDAASMERVVRLAKKYRVKVGAHPSYPDRANFGRSALAISPESLIHSIREQVSALTAILHKEGIGLHHIKAHGALYHETATNPALADVFLKAVSGFGKDVLIYAPYASTIAQRAIEHGFSIAREAFADRNYKPDLSLLSRKHPQALITSPGAVLEHIVHMVKQQKVRSIENKEVKMLADTFCIHSDTPSAFEIVSYLSQELPFHNIQIKK